MIRPSACAPKSGSNARAIALALVPVSKTLPGAPGETPLTENLATSSMVWAHMTWRACPSAEMPLASSQPRGPPEWAQPIGQTPPFDPIAGQPEPAFEFDQTISW